jgi:hypothetical protein
MEMHVHTIVCRTKSFSNLLVLFRHFLCLTMHFNIGKTPTSTLVQKALTLFRFKTHNFQDND